MANQICGDSHVSSTNEKPSCALLQDTELSPEIKAELQSAKYPNRSRTTFRVVIFIEAAIWFFTLLYSLIAYLADKYSGSTDQ
jgi:hypothetical protein